MIFFLNSNKGEPKTIQDLLTKWKDQYETLCKADLEKTELTVDLIEKDDR